MLTRLALILFFSFHFVPSFYPFRHLRRSFPPFIPTGAPQPEEESTYKHHQPGNPRILTATTISRAPPFFYHRAYGGGELSGGGCRLQRRPPRSVLLRFDIPVSSLSPLKETLYATRLCALVSSSPTATTLRRLLRGSRQ